jgi:hypothetical protein
MTCGPGLPKCSSSTKTERLAKITNVHVWDGSRAVEKFDGLSLSGDHSGGVDAQNSWTLTPAAPIQFGLGLSVGVDLEGIIDGGPGLILITTAGADFETQ